MRSPDSPYLADWFAVSLRWLSIVGGVISLSLWGDLIAWPNVTLLVILLWNLALTLLAGLNIRLPYHRHICLGLDLLAVGLYFFLSGGFASPVWWLGILPIMIAALYFEWRGMLVTVPLVSIIQMIATAIQSTHPYVLFFPAGAAVLFLLGGLLFAFVGTRLYRILRQNYQAHLEAQMQKRRIEQDRIRAIYRLTSTLASTLNYQRVLDSVLDLSLTAVNTDPDMAADERLVSVVMLFSKSSKLEIASARRLTPADKRAILPGQKGSIGQAIEDDQPVVLKDVKKDPELGRLVTFRACEEVYCFPLRSGFNAYGILLFGHPQAGYFTPDRRETLDILGRQAVFAIQNARLYQDLLDERDRMIEVQEEARKKLARDLHDGPTQSVSAIAMRINLVQRMITRDPRGAREELNRIEDLARRTTKEIRHMLFTLRPLVLESQGLAAALKSMAEKIKETYSQDVQVQVDESLLENVEMGKQSVIFYLAEEAVNNARKHAKAAHIWVRLLSFGQDIIRLEVQDDGSGFDVEAVTRAYDQRGSLGLVNLHERTELVNGVLNIQSAPGKGTLIRVYIPLSEEAADQLHRSAKK
jgi:signal transduction histidine kinase